MLAFIDKAGQEILTGPLRASLMNDASLVFSGEAGPAAIRSVEEKWKALGIRRSMDSGPIIIAGILAQPPRKPICPDLPRCCVSKGKQMQPALYLFRRAPRLTTLPPADTLRATHSRTDAIQQDTP